MKYLIVNADDFGYSSMFNEKILELLENDKITSTTVMVNRVNKNQDGQIERLSKLNNNKKISVGLHFEFDGENYCEQMKNQLKRFKDIFKKNPSHLDIHKSLLFPKAESLVSQFAEEIGVPCRNFGINNENTKTTDEKTLCATIGFGPIKSFSEVENWLKNLEDEKRYEICFHPGQYDPNCKSSLNKDREKDVKNILKLNEILDKNGVKKISFHNL